MLVRHRAQLHRLQILLQLRRRPEAVVSRHIICEDAVAMVICQLIMGFEKDAICEFLTFLTHQSNSWETIMSCSYRYHCTAVTWSARPQRLCKWQTDCADRQARPWYSTLSGGFITEKRCGIWFRGGEQGHPSNVCMTCRCVALIYMYIISNEPINTIQLLKNRIICTSNTSLSSCCCTQLHKMLKSLMRAKLWPLATVGAPQELHWIRLNVLPGDYCVLVNPQWL